MNAAIITISDKSYAGERTDTSGEIIKNILEKENFEIIKKVIIPDEIEIIKNEIKTLCNNFELDLIITTGGTGISKRDVTPEAVKLLIDKEIPGIPEIIRIESFKKTPLSVLSRSLCGIINKTILLTLPGSPNAVKESLLLVLPALKHGIEIVKGKVKECANLHSEVNCHIEKETD